MKDRKLGMRSAGSEPPSPLPMAFAPCQAVKEAIATIGEKISIRRFVKFQLGEGIEKKVMDLAADVAAMTTKSS